MNKDEIKPGDHITIAGTVDYIDKYGTMSITTKSGYVINAKLEDIRTHRPKDNDGYFVKTTEFESYKRGKEEI